MTPLITRWSVADVRNFIAAKDISLREMIAARRELGFDPDTSWKSDLADFIARWESAKKSATTRTDSLALIPLPNDAIPDSDAMDALFRTLNPGMVIKKVEGMIEQDIPQGVRVVRGSLQDLWDRLTRAYQAKFHRLPSMTPGDQLPGTGADMSSAFYKTVAAIDNRINPRKNPFPYMIVGGAVLAGILLSSLLRPRS